MKVTNIKAADYYGTGYQDMQNRVPSIENIRRELGWAPRVAMPRALEHIFEAYREHVGSARELLT